MSESDMNGIELTGAEVAVLKQLASGSTYEYRNIVWEGRSTPLLNALCDRGLLRFVGSNGSCDYWKITEKGKQLVSDTKTKEEAHTIAPFIPTLTTPSVTHWLDLDKGHVWTASGQAPEYQNDPNMSQLSDRQLGALNRWVQWQVDMIAIGKDERQKELDVATATRIEELERKNTEKVKQAANLAADLATLRDNAYNLCSRWIAPFNQNIYSAEGCSEELRALLDKTHTLNVMQFESRIAELERDMALYKDGMKNLADIRDACKEIAAYRLDLLRDVKRWFDTYEELMPDKGSEELEDILIKAGLGDD